MRALKTEFSELMISLRAYTKENKFNRTVQSIGQNFDNINENIQTLDQAMKKQAIATAELLKNKTALIE